VCIHRDECVCVVSVSDVLCNSKKNIISLTMQTGEEGPGTHDHLIFFDNSWATNFFFFCGEAINFI
jgi:hypothetical protein